MSEHLGPAPPPADGALADVLVLPVGPSRAAELLGALLAGLGAHVLPEAAPGEQAEASVRSAIGRTAELGGAALVVVAAGPRDILRPHHRYGDGRAGPQLVWCVIEEPPPGGGSELADADADADARVAAALGLDELSGIPVRPEPLPIGTVYGAALAAVYVCAGLLTAERTGEPVFVRVPMVAAAATVLSRKLIRADDPGIIEYATEPHLPISEIYACADGQFVQSHGLYDRFVEILLTEGGHPEWITAALPGLLAFSSPDDELLWRSRLAGIFLTRDARDWEQVINERGGACTRVRTPQEWLVEPNRLDAGLPPDPRGRAIHAVSVYPNRDTPAGAGPAREPQKTQEPREPPGPGLPLSGIRVMDFCIVLAGPTCGRILADLGAEVVKIDDPARPCPPLQWLDVNRGKRSLLLDLRAPGGAQIARDLIDGADVVLENYRAGRLAAAGLGYQQVSRGRPDVVYASMNAFDFGGAWESWAGWEHNAQAASGMQAARGRDRVPQQVPVPVNDYVTGLYTAFGVVASLRHRARTGRGALVRASLARSASITMQRRRAEDGRRPLAPGTRVGSSAFRQRLLDEGILTRWRHPVLGWLEQVTPRPATEPPLDRGGWPAPQPGADAASILALTGRDQAEHERLVAAGVVYPERSFASAPAGGGLRRPAPRD
jgi:crotonobetainyl-CoA:carnitine CoA-transferase CaiB-like acyl-CoA transferase